MTVTRQGADAIVLSENCPVDDAEPLLQMLLATPTAVVDWGGCQSLHTAVVQVILAAKPTLRGRCGDAWIDRWVPG